MSHTLTIAAREVRERSFVLLAAVFIAVLPFAAALMPGAKRFGASGFIAGMGGILALAFTLGLAAILGASVVGRELSERRLSFYFAKPVSAASIWFGKITGAIAIASICFAIIFVPAVTAARGAWRTTWDIDPLQLSAIVLGVSILLLLIAHALSTMIRSRSPMAAVDLVAAAVIAGAVWMIVRSLFDALAVKLAAGVGAALVLMLAIALVGAGAWQLSRGRADVRRNHHEFSRFLWIAMAVAVAIAAAYVMWVFNAEPEDLIKPQVTAAHGEWVTVGGAARYRADYSPTFLLNTSTGEWARFPVMWYSGQFTHDGTAVFGVRPDPRNRRMWNTGELIVQRLGQDRRPVDTGIPARGYFFVSDDGRRVAVMDQKTLSVHDIASKRLIAAVPLPKDLHPGGLSGFFVSPDVLRIFQRWLDSEKGDVTRGGVRIFELHIPSRRLVQTGEWSTTARWLYLEASADGSTIIARGRRSADDKTVHLLDGRSGELRMSLAGDDAIILESGSIAVLSGVPERVMTLYTPDGTAVRQVDLGSARGALLAGRSSTGELVLTLSHGEPGSRRFETVVVDVNSGRVLRRDRGLRPWYDRWSSDPRERKARPAGEFVVEDEKGTFWRWNARTGEKKKII